MCIMDIFSQDKKSERVGRPPLPRIIPGSTPPAVPHRGFFFEQARTLTSKWFRSKLKQLF